MTGFPHTGMVAVFFIYGLAFFAMGLAIALETRRSSATKLADSLWLLAAFGLLYGTTQWIDMLMLVQTQGAIPGASPAVRILRVGLSVVAALCLLTFGARLVTSTTQRHQWLLWLPLGLLSAWIATSVLPSFQPLEGAAPQTTASCLQCHWTASGAYVVASKEWLTKADVWARYLLFLPGSVLAALAFLSQRPYFREMGLPQIARHCSWAAAAFAFNALAAGVIVPPAPFPPASFLNFATFLAATGVVPQILWAISAFGIAFFVVRILRVFEIEQSRKLELAHQERFHAQQEALEAQRRAREQMENWSHELELRVQQRTKELEALYTIATEVSALLSIDKILDSVVSEARSLLGADVASLSLLDPAGKEISSRTVSGARTEAFQGLRLHPGEGIAGQAIASGWPIVVANHHEDPSLTSEITAVLDGEGLASHLAVPLKMGDKPLGALYVASRMPRSFAKGDIDLLTRLANQAAIAIENARLYERVQEMAVLEERDRLAREMHDSLAQALGYLGMKASIVADLLTKGKVAEAGSELARMMEMADDAYSDVREAILGLRTTVSPTRGLLPTLTEFLRQFSLQNGIRTELVVPEGLVLTLPAGVEIQLLRVVQEALTNIRKHAHASRAWVHFEKGQRELALSIEDNGVGFDREEVAHRGGQHFGLETMRERAESMGGRFLVESAPGRGTKVKVMLPINGGG